MFKQTENWKDCKIFFFSHALGTVPFSNSCKVNVTNRRRSVGLLHVTQFYTLLTLTSRIFQATVGDSGGRGEGGGGGDKEEEALL